MRCREFITVLGGAAVTGPHAARAHQPTMLPIGFLNSQSPPGFAEPLRGFRQGLKEAGYVEGGNLTIEYRWANNQADRLPALAADLVRRRVTAIAAMGSDAALEAKTATTTIPIVFNVGDDSVKLGLVASLSLLGGNLTGVNFFTTELVAKRLELLRALVPGAAHIAVLVNPATAAITETARRDVQEAARAMGLQIRVLNAGTQRRDQCGLRKSCARAAGRPVCRPRFSLPPGVSNWQLAARHVLPATYAQRQCAEVGGLMKP
jgi:putative ABC transport system substrate-binding protein